MTAKEIVYKKIQSRTKTKITDSSNIYDIGIDSLDLVDMITDFEREHKIKIDDKDLVKVSTVGDIVNILDKLLHSKKQ